MQGLCAGCVRCEAGEVVLYAGRSEVGVGSLGHGPVATLDKPLPSLKPQRQRPIIPIILDLIAYSNRLCLGAVRTKASILLHRLGKLLHRFAPPTRITLLAWIGTPPGTTNNKEVERFSSTIITKFLKHHRGIQKRLFETFSRSPTCVTLATHSLILQASRCSLSSGSRGWSDPVLL